MKIKTYLSAILMFTGLAGSMLIAAPAFAQTTPVPQNGTHMGWGGGTAHGRMPGVFGTVSAIDGTQ